MQCYASHLMMSVIIKTYLLMYMFQHFKAHYCFTYNLLLKNYILTTQLNRVLHVIL
jgi:hypothetical protein